MLFKLEENQFYLDSLIFFIASFSGGFGNYIFHSLTARLLSPSSYGELQSLISLSVILGIPVGVLFLVITKYTAEFKAKNENQKIYFLFKNFTKKFFLLGILLFIFLLIVARFILNFLALTSLIPLIVLIASFIFVFSAALNNALLQGLQKFKALSVISIISMVLKIILAFIFIKLSLAVSGVVGAIVLSGLVAYGLTFMPLRSLASLTTPTSLPSLPLRQMLCFSAPVFFTLLFTTLLYNLDIILIKHFFTPELAGQYAALALLGHIVFFIIGPLIAVMFPAAAAAHISSERSLDCPNLHNSPDLPDAILKKTLLMSVSVGLMALVFYFTFPALIIKIIVGVNYLELAPYLGWFALAMFLFSIVFLISQYFLSINQTRFVYFLGASVLAQIIFIFIWHQSLWQIIWIMNGVMATCLAGLAIYYTKTLKH